MYNPNSDEWPQTKDGGLRRLRLGEINLASSLYGYSIRYNQVWVHLESYLPFNLQNPVQAMSPMVKCGSGPKNMSMTFRCQREMQLLPNTSSCMK